MIERAVYRNIQKIGDPTLRGLAEGTARLVLENWGYLLFLLVLWRFPYLVADLTGSEVMPRRPSGDSAFWQSVMAQSLLLACLAMSYNLLFGFAGVISFGHALFFGVGSYTAFILLNKYDPSYQQGALIAVNLVVLLLAVFTQIPVRRLFILLVGGILMALVLLPNKGNISVYQAVGVGVLVSIALSLVSGTVTLRLRGVYFTMFTLAFAQMFWVLAKSGTLRDITGAEDGLPVRDLIPESLNPTPTFTGNRLDMYRLTVVFFVIIFLAVRRYINSPVGRVMLAIRENEHRARAIGYNVFYYKLITMTFAGVIATLAGVLFVLWGTAKRVDPSLLSLKYTVDPLLMTLIGGMGTLTGPVVAALGLEMGRTYLREETFTLNTSILGLVAIWQVITLVVLALCFYTVRRALKSSGEWILARLGKTAGSPDYAWLLRAYQAAVILLTAVIVLWVVWPAYHDSDIQTKVYQVADLWNLFLGIVFVIVVMLLPLGIVGTWNKWQIERRIRQIERDIQRQKDAVA